jgi:arginase
MASLAVIGVPMSLGASQAGCEGGPTALRAAGLLDALRALGHSVVDSGDLPVPARPDSVPPTRPHHRDAILALCTALADRTAAAVLAGGIPVVLGGDHALEAGSVAGVSRAYRAQGKRLGLIVLDAHGDLHTPGSSFSGNMHGMSVAHLLGHGDPALASLAGHSPAVAGCHTLLIGVRALEAKENAHIAAWGVGTAPMSAFRSRPLSVVLMDCLQRLALGLDGIYLSVDLDALDPTVAPGVGTPVPMGLSVADARQIVASIVAGPVPLAGLEIVELNPRFDTGGQTAALAVGLAGVAFGAVP